MHSNSQCGGGMCSLSMVAKYLLIVGGLNWGLVGTGMLANATESWNVVNMLLGNWPMVEGIVYVLVGLAALLKLVGCRCAKCTSGVCTDCGPKSGEQKM